MIAHEPFNGIDLIRFQSQTRCDLAHHLGTQDRVIFRPPFGDVMQQQRNIQHFAVHAVFKDGGYQWQVFDQFAAFDLGKVGDALDRVFVHGV